MVALAVCGKASNLVDMVRRTTLPLPRKSSERKIRRLESSRTAMRSLLCSVRIDEAASS